MIAIPLLWGQALALVVTKEFDWLWFAVIHVFGALCQVYALYLNDYADESLDRLNDSYWLSGGSRVIPDGLLSGAQLYRASFVVLCCLLLVCALAFAEGRIWMPLLGVLAIVLGWAYSLAPIKSSYRGFGEIHQGLTCGAYLPITAFYLQTGSLTGFPWLMLLPVCLIFYAGNIITALPDVSSDKMGGKKTYPVRHGGERARRDALLILLLAYLLIVAPGVSSLGILSGLVIASPALVLLLYVLQSGWVKNAEAENRSLCKRYVFFTTMSQLWVMCSWTVLLFWVGLNDA